MGLALYDRAFVFCKGQLLGESSGGQLEYQGENQPVETLAKELAGFTPVPKRAMLRVNSFVPAAGFEFDVVDSYLKNEILTFKVQFGGSGLAMEADGWIVRRGEHRSLARKRAVVGRNDRDRSGLHDAAARYCRRR